MKQLYIIIFTVISIQAFGQRTADPWEVYRGKYCYYEDTEQFYGDTVKIWSDGGYYPGFCTSKSDYFYWASDSLKSACDCSYSPIDGELGIIKFASPILNDRTGINNIIYIVELQNHTVAIGCGWIIEKDSLSLGEQTRIIQLNDSIENAEYANGCLFKTSYVNGSYFEAGVHTIDIRSESFACELEQNEVDTILLLKGFYNNHGLGNSKVISVFWTNHGESFLKIFRQTDNSIEASETYKTDLSTEWAYYNLHDIPNLETNPQPNTWISHDFTYYIQFKTSHDFYLESLTRSEVRGDESHEKSIWWNMLIEKTEEKIKN
jgi:hypothetical protein